MKKKITNPTFIFFSLAFKFKYILDILSFLSRATTFFKKNTYNFRVEYINFYQK